MTFIEGIKVRLGITGSYHDAQLSAYVEDVKEFLLSGGVSELVMDSDKADGVIARGVADLWNYGSGDGKFSEMFFQRMTQLVLMGDSIEDGSIIPIDKEDIDECTKCLED